VRRGGRGSEGAEKQEKNRGAARQAYKSGIYRSGSSLSNLKAKDGLFIELSKKKKKKSPKGGPVEDWHEQNPPKKREKGGLKLQLGGG